VSAGQATTCGTPGLISWSQPGQRYVFPDPAPATERTIQSPSGADSIRWWPNAFSTSRGCGRPSDRPVRGSFLRGLTGRFYRRDTATDYRA
jgi:hypothetical protein